MDSYVQRQYDDDRASTFHNVWKLIDPDSVRAEPDVPDIEESLEIVNIELQQLHDAVSTVGSAYKHTQFQSIDDGLKLTGNDDTSGAAVTIHSDVPDGINSFFSNDYLTDIADAVQSLQPESVTLMLGEEYPMKVEWERDDGVSGMYMLAPRVER